MSLRCVSRLCFLSERPGQSDMHDKLGADVDGDAHARNASAITRSFVVIGASIAKITSESGHHWLPAAVFREDGEVPAWVAGYVQKALESVRLPRGFANSLAASDDACVHERLFNRLGALFGSLASASSQRPQAEYAELTALLSHTDVREVWLANVSEGYLTEEQAVGIGRATKNPLLHYGQQHAGLMKLVKGESHRDIPRCDCIIFCSWPLLPVHQPSAASTGGCMRPRCRTSAACARRTA